MPHLHTRTSHTQDEYDMIQDNQVPIDVFVANKIREDAMFVYVQEQMLDTEVHRTTSGVTSYTARRVPDNLSENPTKGRQFVIFRL